MWRKNYEWFNLTHVCRRWRAVVFASASRLDLTITLGPQGPDDIETTLPGFLQILVNYRYNNVYVTDSALRHLRSALEHRGRVREIFLTGPSVWFDVFFEATKCSFPVLESLFLSTGNRDLELEVPDTFLGPDLSNLRLLRSLTLYDVSLASISRFLSFATSLTDLDIRIYHHLSPSEGMSLLAILQGMPCLCYLSLLHMIILSSDGSSPIDSSSQPLVPKHTVPLSKLTSFYYDGSNVFLHALVAGLSAPSLRRVNFNFRDPIRSPIVQLPRFINEIEEQCSKLQVYINKSWLSWVFYLSFQKTPEDDLEHELSFELGPDRESFPGSLMQLSGALSTRLTTVEVLQVKFGLYNEVGYVWEDYIPWSKFYQHFPSVKTLQVTHSMARTLRQDHGEPEDSAFFPALEEIELYACSLNDKTRPESQLAAFQPFVSARQQAGRPVKVFLLRQ
jgi:hypothetical protein